MPGLLLEYPGTSIFCPYIQIKNLNGGYKLVDKNTVVRVGKMFHDAISKNFGAAFNKNINCGFMAVKINNFDEIVSGTTEAVDELCNVFKGFIKNKVTVFFGDEGIFGILCLNCIDLVDIENEVENLSETMDISYIKIVLINSKETEDSSNIKIINTSEELRDSVVSIYSKNDLNKLGYLLCFGVNNVFFANTGKVIYCKSSVNFNLNDISRLINLQQLDKGFVWFIYNSIKEEIDCVKAIQGMNIVDDMDSIIPMDGLYEKLRTIQDSQEQEKSDEVEVVVEEIQDKVNPEEINIDDIVIFGEDDIISDNADIGNKEPEALIVEIEELIVEDNVEKDNIKRPEGFNRAFEEENVNDNESAQVEVVESEIDRKKIIKMSEVKRSLNKTSFEQLDEKVETIEIGDMPDNPTRGALITVCANKGGVGKTTSSLTLGIALANAGISTCITDLDFEGQSVAPFFNLDPKSGIECLLGAKKIDTLLEHYILQTKHDNLYVMPGPVNKGLIPDEFFVEGNLIKVLDVMLNKFEVIIADTPPNFWTKPWLPEVFSVSDLVFAVVNQSKFSIDDTKEYAPKIIAMGTDPSKIKIILNNYSTKLTKVKTVEDAFCSGFKSDFPKSKLPRVIATIPHDWDVHATKSYKGEVVGLDNTKSQWHKIAKQVAELIGIKYTPPEVTEKRSLFLRLFKRG